MSKHYIWNIEDVLPQKEKQYQSRVMLDEKKAGEPCIAVNHGLLEKGKTDAFVFDKAVVYIGLSGKAGVVVAGEVRPMKKGTVIYLPAHTEHYIENVDNESAEWLSM